MTKKLSDLSQEEINSSIEQASRTLVPELDPNTFSIGQNIFGKGLYAGTYTIENSKFFWGEKTKIFDLYAAEKDLPKEMTYDDMRGYLRKQDSLFGHRIMLFPTDNHLKEAFNIHIYEGEWFIPTLDMLKNIQTHFGARVLRLEESEYWSSTTSSKYKDPHHGPRYLRYAYDFYNHMKDDHMPDLLSLPTRLFRAELRTKNKGPK